MCLKILVLQILMQALEFIIYQSLRCIMKSRSAILHLTYYRHSEFIALISGMLSNLYQISQFFSHKISPESPRSLFVKTSLDRFLFCQIKIKETKLLQAFHDT
jgi:hypothetical protein